jgi:flagellar biosynthesis GTPase FlhF
VAAAVETGERDLLGSIAERMRSVEESLHRMSHQRANALASEGPVELQELRHKFIDHGVNAHVLALLIERLAEGVRPTLSALQVARAAERVLSTLLPPTPRLDFGVGSGPLVVFVVGPHGAGKTSVALKLAHDYAEAQAGRAIMVGTDVGRAGAPQQLLAAAAAAQVDAQLCYTPGELRSLVRSQPSGLLIVDTPAPAVGRRDEMLELTTFAQVAPRRATLLALPAWLGAMDAQRATSMFAPLGLTGLVATHVDQAMSFGGVVSAAIQSSIGVAYTSASDGLTDGLSTGDNHALAIAVLTGAWPRVPAAAPEGALSGFRS